MKYTLLIILFITFSCCSTKNETLSFKDNFENQEKFASIWENDTRGQSPHSYSIESGNLKITTRAKTKDRVKTKTRKNEFKLGTYLWRIYVPQFNLGDQCSIGAFVYHYKKGDIEYEYDFEIGSGNEKHRLELNTKPNEAIVHCTSQFSPFSSERFKLKTEQWYNFKMELSSLNDSYIVKWYINNSLVKTLQTNVNIDIAFTIHNSLENLEFMGDHLPNKKNVALFDSFEFIEKKSIIINKGDSTHTQK